MNNDLLKKISIMLMRHRGKTRAQRAANKRHCIGIKPIGGVLCLVLVASERL